MDHFEETRPSFQTNSFISTSIKSSILDHTSDISRKIPRKPIHSQSPYKEILSSRRISSFTPRTQISSFSHTLEKEIQLNDTLSKSKDDFKSIDSATLEFTLDDDHKDIPTLRWCAFCRREAMTEIYYKNSKTTFWSSVGIFLMGGVCGCFLVPYMFDSCKDMASRCSKCKRDVGLGNEELIE